MKVVIFCGGKGFRLYEETEFKPKPLVPIGGKPILYHIMNHYSRYGFNQFILCLGYRGDMIKSYFKDYDVLNNDVTVVIGQQRDIIIEHSDKVNDMVVTLADTGLESNTARRLALVQKYIGNDTCMLTYGDGLSDINLQELLLFHKAHGKIATVTAVHPISKYGVIKSQNGIVEHFSEKPVENDRISAGYFVFEPQIFDYLDDGMLEQTPLHRLAKDGQLCAYEYDGFFCSMDTYRDYNELNKIWDNGQAKWIK